MHAFPGTDGFELRRYAPALLAEHTPVANSEQQRSAFRDMAGYLGVYGTPANARREPIAMTAPVLTSRRHEMIFVLPSALTAESAPAPTSAAVVLRERPEVFYVAQRYRGTATEADAAARARLLAAAVRARGGWRVVADDGDEAGEQDAPSPKWLLGRFNPPYTLPWMKTNEVLVEVEEDASCAAVSAP